MVDVHTGMKNDTIDGRWIGANPDQHLGLLKQAVFINKIVLLFIDAKHA